tara:strand:+ start:111 stop:320 length:210 start_codon:yes stop_codon:yes gene_type:complete
VITFVNYVAAFWSVVVMNCIQPVNWNNCKDLNEWLVPGIREGVEILLNPSTIYQSERDYLDNINKDKKK